MDLTNGMFDRMIGLGQLFAGAREIFLVPVRPTHSEVVYCVFMYEHW